MFYFFIWLLLWLYHYINLPLKLSFQSYIPPFLSFCNVWLFFSLQNPTYLPNCGSSSRASNGLSCSLQPFQHKLIASSFINPQYFIYFSIYSKHSSITVVYEMSVLPNVLFIFGWPIVPSRISVCHLTILDFLFFL